MEEIFKLTSASPYSELLEYFNNPRNIMKYIPMFNDIINIDENTFLVKIGWIFNIDLKVFKISNKNRITYIVEHKSFPSIVGKLDHILEPKQGQQNLTEINIIFYYSGPFEIIVKLQARKLYNSIQKQFSVNNYSNLKLEEKEFNEEKTQMKTILSGTIDIQNIDTVISKAILESKENEIELIISKGDTSIKLIFIDGTLVKQIGSLSDLKGRSKFLLRKKE
ncbi:hypothetical protein [Acidianus manzaensis]|uniref:Polyketide cyclase n=1 Tax=Acidianus manzaensis TaxID=282676 RepID=A0A1W6JXM4_9CREN|nr:hypothetical protein [Acidianus manzaensis]ARM74980.1 hypothetical protein B6F84_02335 [Acidianus manzaensis]